MEACQNHKKVNSKLIVITEYKHDLLGTLQPWPLKIDELSMLSAIDLLCIAANGTSMNSKIIV